MSMQHACSLPLSSHVLEDAQSISVGWSKYFRLSPITMKKLVIRRLNSWITSLPLRLVLFSFDDLDSILGPRHRRRTCQVSVRDNPKENLYQVSCLYLIPSVPVRPPPWLRTVHLLGPAESCSVFPEWPKRAFLQTLCKAGAVEAFPQGREMSRTEC